MALTAAIYIGSKIKSGRLIRLGRTIITSGEYWLLEATDRASAKARGAFVGWINRESRGPERVGAAAVAGGSSSRALT